MITETESFMYFYKLADGTECATTNERLALLRAQQEGTDIVYAEPIP
jgi:hypothetical protein